MVWTGAADSGAVLVRTLADLGAKVRCRPVIEIRPLMREAELSGALFSGPDYRFVAVTSAKAAALLPRGEGFDGTVVAVGPATAAAVRERGFRKLRIPEVHSAEGAAALISAEGRTGDAVLFVQGNRALATLPDALSDAGFDVTCRTAYETVPVSTAQLNETLALIRRTADGIAVGSPSGVGALETVWTAPLAELKPGAVWLCLGPTTARALAQRGVRALFPEQVTPAALSAAFLPALSPER